MLLRFCGWCGKHLSPFMFNKVYTKEVPHRPFWFCSLRCYTEWHRRFYVKRRMLNVQFEGNPLENAPQTLPQLPE